MEGTKSIKRLYIIQRAALCGYNPVRNSILIGKTFNNRIVITHKDCLHYAHQSAYYSKLTSLRNVLFSTYPQLFFFFFTKLIHAAQFQIKMEARTLEGNSTRITAGLVYNPTQNIIVLVTKFNKVIQFKCNPLFVKPNATLTLECV